MVCNSLVTKGKETGAVRSSHPVWVKNLSKDYVILEEVLTSYYEKIGRSVLTPKKWSHSSVNLFYLPWYDFFLLKKKEREKDLIGGVPPYSTIATAKGCGESLQPKRWLNNNMF